MYLIGDYSAFSGKSMELGSWFLGPEHKFRPPLRHNAQLDDDQRYRSFGGKFIISIKIRNALLHILYFVNIISDIMHNWMMIKDTDPLEGNSSFQ